FTSTLPVTAMLLVRFPAQVSLAVAPGSVKVPWHSTVTVSAPLSAIVGDTVSTTLTVRVAVVVFVPSVAVGKGVVARRIYINRPRSCDCSRTIAGSHARIGKGTVALYCQRIIPIDCDRQWPRVINRHREAA